jgi:1-acyl-sn-glycerol-3-phosphate acyltransferase
MAWQKNFMRAGAAFDFIGRPFMTLDFDREGELGEGPVLMAANHRSLLDVFVALICCYRLGRPTKFIVGRVFFKKPGLGIFLRAIGCIEGGKGSGADVIAIEEIAKGVTCAIMPEGAIKTMEPGRVLAPLLPGVSTIWEKAQCPFHAVGIAGAGAVWPDGRNFPPLPKRKSQRPVVRVRLTAAVLPGLDPCSIERVTTIMEDNCLAAESDRVAALHA